MPCTFFLILISIVALKGAHTAQQPSHHGFVVSSVVCKSHTLDGLGQMA